MQITINLCIESFQHVEQKALRDLPPFFTRSVSQTELLKLLIGLIAEANK